jgi:hypothetical protein
LQAIFRALRQFTNVSVPCNGFFVSLYDPIRDVRTACYGWADGGELDVSELPPMAVTTTGPNSRAVRTGEVVITNDYMRATQANPGIIVGPDNGLRPDSSMAVPMAVMGRIIGTIEVQSYEKNVYRPEHVTAMSMGCKSHCGCHRECSTAQTRTHGARSRGRVEPFERRVSRHRFT